METKRLYSTIEIKSADSDQWTFTGLASSPRSDRQRDTVNSKGATYTLPLPLLWQHDHNKAIGHVTEASIGDDGITIAARITQPTDDMPQGLSARLQEAWSSIKSGLVRGLSIGFVPTEYAPNKNGGLDIKSWDWLELSAVVIAANQDASIATVKRFSYPIKTHDGYQLRSSHFYLRNT